MPKPNSLFSRSVSRLLSSYPDKQKTEARAVPPGGSPNQAHNFLTPLKNVSRAAAICGMSAFVLSAGQNAQAQTSTDNKNSAIALDNLLKTLTPDQKMVYIDDMGFKVETLKAWRNEFAGGKTTKGAFGSDRVWTNSRVPYIFDGNMNESARVMVRDAMFEWQKNANIALVPRLTSDPDYVRFFYNGSGGMSSSVGRIGGEQTINIDDSRTLYRCAHEIGHCMGFIHEQNRSDRDTFITVTSTSGSIDALKDVNWMKYPPSQSLNQGPYDYDSMMHYPARGAVVSGASATMTPKDPYYTNAGKPTLGQRNHISALDAAAMARRYGAPCSISGRVTSSTGVGLRGLTLTCTPTGDSAYYGPSVTTDSNGNYILPGTARGNYSVTLSGGVVPVSTSVTIDTTPVTNINFTVSAGNRPTISISSPVADSTAESVPTASGNATDDLGVDYVGVLLKNNADGKWWVWSTNSWGDTIFDRTKHFKTVDNPSNSTNFDWSTPLPSLPNGSYNLQAIAVDVADYDSGAYTSLNYNIGTLRPIVRVTYPGYYETIPTLTNIAGTATDADDGIAGNVVNVTLIHDGQYWTGAAWQSTPVTFSVSVSNGIWSTTSVPKGANLLDGQYAIKAETTDTQGHASAVVLGANVTAFIVDSVEPTASIIEPANNSTINGLTVISGLADDTPSPSPANMTVDIERLSDHKFWDNTGWGDGSATLALSYTPSTKEWRTTGPLPSGTNTSTGLASGSYRIMFIVQDNAGHRKQVDSYFNVINSYLWTGATMRDNIDNNNSNNWDVAANWSPEGVPGPSDAAVIANGDTVQADGSHSITTLGILGSTLNTTGLLVKNLELLGTINGGAVNSNGGTWNWYGGSISGNWSVLSGATWNISNTADVVLGDNTKITNTGIINWSGPGKISCSGYYGGSIINNENGAVFNLLKDGIPLGTTYGSTFNNALGAKLVKSGGGGDTVLSGWTLNNGGQLVSNLGSLNYNTTLNLNDKGTVTGSGKHTMLGGTLNLSGTTTASAGAFTISDGAVNGVGALATFATASGGAWNWNGGGLSGLFANTGTFNIGGTAGKAFGDKAVFNNTGKVTWSGGDIFCSGYYGGAAFNNKGAGVFTATSGNKFTTTYGSTFNNASGATFERTGSATTQSNWAFNNDGLAKTTAGTLILNAGGTGFGRFQTGTGTFVKFTGGNHTLSNSRLLGTGKVQLTGGSITLNGNLTLGDTASPSTLEVSGGTLVGTVVKVNNVVKSNTIIASGNTKRSLLNWMGGTLSGTQTWEASLQTDISDPTTGKTDKVLGDGSVINNDGIVSWRGAGPITCSGYYGYPTFNNRKGATFTFANAGTPFSSTYGATLNNLAGGAVVKNGTGTLSLKSWAFTNAGTLTTNAGMTEYTSTLTLNAGTALTGVGTTRFAGTINANTPFSATGPVQLDAGNFNGGPLTVFTGKAFLWMGGAINTQFTLNTGSAMTLSGTAAKVLGDNAVFNNKGAVTWSGPGAIDCSGYYGYPTFNNRQGATFTCATGGTPFSTTYGATFNNQVGAKLVKSGTGTLTLAKWLFNTESEVATANGTTEWTSTLNLKAGSKFSGAGTIRFAGTVNASAPFSSAGPIRLDTGSLNGTSAASFTGTSFSWTGGAITGQLTLNPASIISVSGTTEKGFGDNAVFNNKGTVKWQGGASLNSSGYYGAPTFNNLSGSVFETTVDGTPFNTTYGHNFNNQAGARFFKSGGAGKTTIGKWTFNNGTWDGKVLLLGGTIEAKTGTIDFTSTLNVRGGVFKGTGQSQWSAGVVNVGAPFTVDNTKLTWSGGTLNGITSGTLGSASLATLGTGNFNWTGGLFTGNLLLAAKSVTNVSGTTAKTMDDNSTLSNAGTLNWTEGDISNSGYYGPATWKNLAGATLNVLGKGTFNSTYGANMNNAGLVNLGTNTLGNSWSYTQASTGTTAININSATLYGKLNTTRSATLAGNLNAVVASTYVAPVGTAFKVITHGSRSGTFGKVTVTGNTTRVYTAKYNPSDVSLVANATTASPRQAAAPTPTPTPASTEAPKATPVPTEVPEATPVPTTAPTQAPSGPISFSSGSVNVSASSIQLTFITNLDTVAASELTHYTVTINGQPVELTGVSVKGNIVTLLVPEGTLHATDSVTVKWESLRNRAGQPLAPSEWNNGQNST